MPIPAQAFASIPAATRAAAKDAADAGGRVGTELFNYMKSKNHEAAANLLATVKKKSNSGDGNGSLYTTKHANRAMYWVGILQSYLDHSHPGHVVNPHTPVSEIQKTLGGIVAAHSGAHGMKAVPHEHITKHENDKNPVVFTPKRIAKAVEDHKNGATAPAVPAKTPESTPATEKPAPPAPSAAPAAPAVQTNKTVTVNGKIKLSRMPVRRADRTNEIWANPIDPSQTKQRAATPLRLAAEVITNPKSGTKEVNDAISVLVSEAVDAHGLNPKSTQAEIDACWTSVFRTAFGKDGPTMMKAMKEVPALQPPVDWFNPDGSLTDDVQGRLTVGGGFGSLFRPGGKSLQPIPAHQAPKLEEKEPEEGDEHEDDEEPEEQEQDDQEQDEEPEYTEVVKTEPVKPARLKDFKGNEPGKRRGAVMKGFRNSELPSEGDLPEGTDIDRVRAVFRESNRSAQLLLGAYLPTPMSKEEQDRHLAPISSATGDATDQLKEHIVRAISRHRHKRFHKRFENQMTKRAEALKKEDLEGTEKQDAFEEAIRNNARYGYWHAHHDDSQYSFVQKMFRRAIVPISSDLAGTHLISRSKQWRAMLLLMTLAIGIPLLVVHGVTAGVKAAASY